MDPERHRRLQELFDATVDLPAPERHDYLERVCGDDPPLRRELDELLEADGAAAAERGAEARPAELGDYRILRELGRGGMGVVYLAERADGAFRRRVAIKVLDRRAGEEEELLRRFRVEREILAALDHPFIARLLDGGTAPDGSPFLVMEHVEGEPIDRWAAARRLSVDRCLELFLGVCDAVQAAHQALVVHRDLKPSNVLVLADGTPKLLDFGIAKLLDPRALERTLVETRLGRQPMTPRYASPEQLTGGAITTATDVYALGVLLYELLTGRFPYRPRSGAAHHWVEAICEQEPLRPSTAVERGDPVGDDAPPAVATAQLARRLAGDLDHVLLAALAKDPRRRYATAAELAADLRRHRDGLPIVARPATLAYRGAKFVRRHRWAVAAGLAFAVGAGAFTAGLVRQLHRTEAERDKARAVTDLLLEVFDLSGPSSADESEPTARGVLERGLERVRGSLAGQPEVEATLLTVLGRAYNNLGRLEEAARAHEEALALRRERRREAPLDYAESLGEMALVHLARAELDRAEAMYREAIAIAEAEVGERDRRSIALADGLVQVLARAGRPAQAAALAASVVARTHERLGYADVAAAVASGSTDRSLVALATTLGTRAAQLRRLGRYDEAAEALTQSLDLERRLLGERHYAVAFDLNNLANVHSNRERHGEAIETRSEGIEIAEAALGAEHPAVASMRLNQGFDLLRAGRAQEALGEIDRASAAFAAALGPEHPAVAMAASFAGLALAQRGRFAEAIDLEQRSLDVLGPALGAEHPDLAAVHAAAGEVLAAAGRPAEGAEHYLRAAAIYEGALGAEHPDTLDSRRGAAESLLAAGRQDEARALAAPVVAALAERPGLERRLARARFVLARARAPVATADPSALALALEARDGFRRAGDEASAAAVEAWLAAAAEPTAAE